MKLTSIYQVHFPAVNWLVAHVEIRRAAKCYQPHNQFGKILWLCAPHTIVPFPKQEYLELQPKILIELEEGSIDTQRDFYFPSIFRPKPLQFFFCGETSVVFNSTKECGDCRSSLVSGWQQTASHGKSSSGVSPAVFCWPRLFLVFSVSGVALLAMFVMDRHLNKRWRRWCNKTVCFFSIIWLEPMTWRYTPGLHNTHLFLEGLHGRLAYAKEESAGWAHRSLVLWVSNGHFYFHIFHYIYI